MAIPVPTIDQITGNTVMVKMRSLIKSYIAFATEISENVPTREDIGEFITPFLSNYYTKEEVDEMLENIDLTDYYKKSQVDALLNDKANVATTYTKSQVDALVSPKADASNVYTKSQTDALISPKADANDVYTKTETDNLLENKQNTLTAGTNISIINDVISATSGNVTMIDGVVERISGSNTRCVITNAQADDIIFLFWGSFIFIFRYNLNSGSSSTLYSYDDINNKITFINAYMAGDSGFFIRDKTIDLTNHSITSTETYLATLPTAKILKSL